MAYVIVLFIDDHCEEFIVPVAQDVLIGLEGGMLLVNYPCTTRLAHLCTFIRNEPVALCFRTLALATCVPQQGAARDPGLA